VWLITTKSGCPEPLFESSQIDSREIGALSALQEGMQNPRRLVLLPLLFVALLTCQCDRPGRNSKNIPRQERTGTNIDGNPATGSVPAAGGLPSGISPSGGQNNRPLQNPDNPQTNPGTNLDGTQAPSPDRRDTAK